MKIFKIISIIGLSAILLFGLIRLQTNIARFGNDDIQIDILDLYTAGQSLNSHVPLYKNGIVLNPPIWDGGHYTHSRFTWPPLAAVPFQLMAGVMPYSAAKFFWMYFSLACLLASVVIVIRTLKLRLKLWQYLTVGIYAALFFPLLPLLERGQIDSFTLLLAVTAIHLTVNRKQSCITAGFLWAFAALIKLHIGLVMLFFILRKQWKILAGFLIGGVAIVILTALLIGPGALPNYLTKELPRIARYGELGTPEMKLPESYFTDYQNKNASKDFPTAWVKDGHPYRGVHLSFAPNASLSRFIVMRIEDFNKDRRIPAVVVSLILLAFFMIIARVGLNKILAKISKLSPDGEFLYWYAILMIIMLLGPQTWTMNAVWLIPLAALALSRNPWSNEKMKTAPWVLLVVALLLAFIPDCMYYGLRNFASPSLACKALDSSKYIFSELLVIVSAWLQIKNAPVTDNEFKAVEIKDALKTN